VPALYLNGGTDYPDKPPGWGVEQLDAYIERNYHQPSDELTDDWRFDGIVQDAQFGFFAGVIVANEHSLPIWSERNEFAATRRAALAAAGTDSRADSPAH